MAGILTAAVASTFGANADPYFEYTTLLLPGNGTNGAQNNTFLDGSTNNFTITRNGNTTQGTFSPFSQTGWSGYFASSTLTVQQRLTGVLSSAIGSGNFTIEFGLYLTGYNNIIGIFLDQPTGLLLYVNNAGRMEFVQRGGSTIIPASSSTQIPLNTWTWVTLTRSGSDVTLNFNGSSVGTGTSSVNFSDATIYIGGRHAIDSGSWYPFQGYLSNYRISNTVRSASVPTSRLTSDANTLFLALQNNRFIDSSSQPLTVSGTVSIQAFSPFNPTASWSAATYGGSGYFDGNGDYLALATGIPVPSTGTFTIEAWVYLTDTTDETVWTQYSAGTAGRSSLRVSSGKLTFANASASTVTTTASVSTNAWTHVAAVRDSSNNLMLFINGSLDITSASYTASIQQIAATIGAFSDASGALSGYISNLRITNTAVYTGAFTPPSLLPLTNAGSTSAASYPSTTNVNTSFASSATSLLLNFTNAGIYDATSKNDLETLDNTVNGVRISTTQSKFGGSSIYFDGTGTDYLWIQADQPIQRFGTAPFTIEMWIRLAALGSARGLVAKGTSTTGWLVSLNTSNQVVFTYGTSTITSTGTISQDVWTYIAVVREGTSTNQTKIYIGGVNDGTGTVSTDFTQTSSMYIGANRTGGDLYSGYIQDVRITNGYARTVTTVPTSAFPTL